MDDIIAQFNKVNAEVDEDIYNFKANQFLEDMEKTGNELQTRAELEQADEYAEDMALQQEEAELQNFLDEQGPLDEAEAERFLNDIDEMAPEEIPEIEYGSGEVPATENTPLMEGQETKFGELEETTFTPAEEAGTVGEVGEIGETAEASLEGFTEIVLETEPLLGEAATSFGMEAGVELTEMAVASSLEVAAGEAAGVAAAEGAVAAGGIAAGVGTAAAVVGPLVAVAGVAYLIYQAVEAMKKYEEGEQTKRDYRTNVYLTYKEANDKSRVLEDFYNKRAAAESKYQDNMYKYVFGWKDPENYPEGRGVQLQKFGYKNDWDDNWTYKEKMNKVAEILKVPVSNISKLDAFNNIQHDKDYMTNLKNIYAEVTYAKQFRNYINNQFVGNVVASEFEKNQMYSVNRMLMTRDGRLLEHYKQQATNDSGYKSALIQLQTSINDKRKAEGNPPLSLSQIESGDARGFESGKGFIPATGTRSRLPFWSIYYKSNKRKFRKQDAVQMNNRYRQWLARDKKPLKHKVTQKEIDFQNSFFIHSQSKNIHGRDMGAVSGEYSNVILDPDGLGSGEEVTFFRRRKKQRRKPQRDIPKDDKKDDKKPIQPDTKINTGTEYLDIDADAEPHQENDFDKNYFFSINTAEHLCRLCARAYDPPEKIETEEGFDVVEFMGSEDLMTETQGRMYFSKVSKVIVIVYRGTDFSRLASSRPDLAIQDIIIDFKALPTLDDVTQVKVHSGFYEYFKQSYTQVQNFVQKYYTDDCLIYTTGHSLGAPPSILCSMYLNKLLQDKVCINYTFGCPRGFTKDSADRVNALASPCYRIADTWDFIAGMPPNLLGYYHIGECHAIDSSYFGVSAKMRLISDKQKANDLFDYPIVNFTFHLMNHYQQSMKFLLEHHNNVGNSFRSENEMIDEGHITHSSTARSNKKAHSTILLTNNHSYRHTGKYFGNKRIYEQVDAQHLQFIPNYHKGHGLTMTPIPANLQKAIVGVYMYREGEFSGKGEVKGIVVY